MPHHLDAVRISLGLAVKSGEVMANEAVEGLYQTGFGFGANMLFGYAILLVSEAIVAGGNVDIEPLSQSHRHWLIGVKVACFGYFKINHFSSDSVHSKPDIDAVLFF